MHSRATTLLPARVASPAGVAIAAGALVEAVLLWGIRAGFSRSFQPVLLVGLVAGGVAGFLTGEYGAAMKNGLFAGFFGAVVYAAGVFAFGVWLSASRGLGWDSAVTLHYGVKAASTSVLFAPVVSAEGALAAVGVHAARLRSNTF